MICLENYSPLCIFYFSVGGPAVTVTTTHHVPAAAPVGVVVPPYPVNPPHPTPMPQPTPPAPGFSTVPTPYPAPSGKKSDFCLNYLLCPMSKYM